MVRLLGIRSAHDDQASAGAQLELLAGGPAQIVTQLGAVTADLDVAIAADLDAKARGAEGADQLIGPSAAGATSLPDHLGEAGLVVEAGELRLVGIELVGDERQ